MPEGFKELLKKPPMDDSESESGEEGCAVPGCGDMRPMIYLTSKQLPGVLEGCQLGEKYLVEVEMTGRETRESKPGEGAGSPEVSGTFLVTSFNPKPEAS